MLPKLRRYSGPAVLFLVETGLQVSGITNLWLAIAVWGLAGIWGLGAIITEPKIRRFESQILHALATRIDPTSTPKAKLLPLVQTPSWLPYRDSMKSFSMREAAFLWCGHDPGRGEIHPGMEEHAVMDLFREALRTNTFPLPAHLRTDFNIDVPIDRAQFRKFAEGLKESARPKFPF